MPPTIRADCRPICQFPAGCVSDKRRRMCDSGSYAACRTDGRRAAPAATRGSRRWLRRTPNRALIETSRYVGAHAYGRSDTVSPVSITLALEIVGGLFGVSLLCAIPFTRAILGIVMALALLVGGVYLAYYEFVAAKDAVKITVGAAKGAVKVTGEAGSYVVKHPDRVARTAGSVAGAFAKGAVAGGG
jgi:hypothetical protein